MEQNKLFYGDNLPLLQSQDFFPNEFVDLIYLDPPFNSSRSYNVLFKDESGLDSEAQIVAFEDTWHWTPNTETLYQVDIMKNSPHGISTAINAMVQLLGRNQMMAYLVMMAVRLVELHRVLKPTGSLYLHCDPTASHYLKIILDSIFGATNFRNEIIWQRTGAKGLASRRLAANHDVILYYAKSDEAVWNKKTTFIPYDEENLDPKTAEKYKYRDEDGRLYRLDNLINPNPNRPNLTYEFLGVTKVWRWTQERMQKAYDQGLVIQTSPGTVPQLKRYLDEQPGLPLGDVWADIPPLNSQAKERLGYPTQKPEALLERIIKASSNPGDLVLDPFCGCGTAIAAAQKLDRRWIGIDITHLSVALQKYRLQDMFELEPAKDYEVIGEPTTLAGAEQLAKDDRYQFQWWALSLVQAKPIGGQKGKRKGKKGADRGIDGSIHFFENGGKTATAKYVLIQVKSGRVNVGDIRDFRGTIDRDNAPMGVFITLKKPTKPMITEAASAGFYESKMWGKSYPRIQILTIEDLMAGKKVKMPPPSRDFSRAQRHHDNDNNQLDLL